MIDPGGPTISDFEGPWVPCSHVEDGDDAIKDLHYWIIGQRWAALCDDCDLMIRLGELVG